MTPILISNYSVSSLYLELGVKVAASVDGV
jgi:hypothetical protein